ncbi:unnamed protein product [Clonostachys rosea f. rosea IK726]|uniref:Uncharacterized protein n=1 Tax=Clonostachys rosea f. rosea IK726 TaxID=1349383 RepID=A0ACA9TTV7_BIOOC|nr:unnamed protein product [Clonostachys rosea f. rosea IK726]
MSDPLLTSLCSICHTSPPKYKCPRCGTRTCSLPCTKKHKSWAECPGTRDPTVYKARKDLRTAAGIDHDYNFLHGMEVAMQRTEKHLVEDRGLVQTEELRPLTMQEVKWKVGRDGRKRKVLVTRVLREAKGRVFERFLAYGLRRLNIRILCAPRGMSREQENKTTLNRRSGRINWQVEWLTFDADEGGDSKMGERATTRILSKSMDDVPLYRAYKDTLDGQKRLANKLAGISVSGRTGIQHMSAATWFPAPSTLQEPGTGSWVPAESVFATGSWPSDEEAELQRLHCFYLANPRQRPDQIKVVTKIASGDCLREILRNTNVFEFPTVYVLPQGQALPTGFVLGPKDMNEESTLPLRAGNKRKGVPDRNNNASRFAKKRKQGGEAGEIGSDEDEVDDDAEDDAGPKNQSVGLELGEVLEEQSFGEEDDDDDSPTSSSGSDSDDD